MYLFSGRYGCNLSSYQITNHISAYRGHARLFLKDLEAIRPSAIIDIIHSGESFKLEQSGQKGMKAMRESPSIHSYTQRYLDKRALTQAMVRNLFTMWIHVL